MRWILWALACIFSLSSLRAEVYYEGTNTFRNYGKVDLNWLVQFLPYNPLIVEAGAYYGAETAYAAKVWPQHHRIVAFEPNPRAFSILQKTITGEKLERVEAYNLALHHFNGTAPLYLSRGPSGKDLSFESESSLLPPVEGLKHRYLGPKIEAGCVILDDWCAHHQIDHIDLLRLDLEGLELQVLRSSPKILKTVHILIVPSFFEILRAGMVYYFDLKTFLTESHFVPLAHWYARGGRGTAVYVSEEMFDAYFVRCLGLRLGGIQYP